MKGITILVVGIGFLIAGAVLFYSMQESKTGSEELSTGNMAIINTPVITVTQPVAPPGGTISPSNTYPKTMTITMNSVLANGPKQQGTVLINEENDKLHYIISVTPINNSTNQPVTINTGSCNNPGQILHTLKNISNGYVEGELDVSIATLITAKPFSINIYASSETITSCGEQI